MIDFVPDALKRFIHIAQSTLSTMLYSDYRMQSEDLKLCPTIDYQSLCRFINIASQNENMQEVVKRATAWQSVYADHKEKIEKDSSENGMSL